MKNKFTLFTYIRKNLINTRNIILIMVTTLLTVILFFALTFYNFTKKTEKYIKTNYMKELNIQVVRKTPNFDSFYEHLNYISSPDHNITYKKEYDNLSNYEHVVSNLPVKYNDEVLLRYKEQDDPDNEKAVMIKGIFKNDSIKLLKGNYPKKGEIVCPPKFYPYSLTKSVFNMNVLKSDKIIDTSKEIGKSYDLVEYRWKTGKNIDVKESKYDNDISLKVVGTYDNKYSFDSMDTCYTSFDTFDLFRDCEFYTTAKYEENYFHYCEPYHGRVLTVDSKDNVSDVISKLEANGFQTYVKGKTEINITSYLYPILMSVVTSILSIVIVLLYINKKCINKQNSYAILQAHGFNNKQIINIELLDNIIIYTIGFVLSLLAYYLLQIYFIKTIFSGYLFFGQSFDIPYLMILNVYILINSIIYIFTKYKISKILKKDIMLNLGTN